MRDYKATDNPRLKRNKTKPNKVKRKRQPRDWRRLLQRALRVTVATVSVTFIVGGAVVAARMLAASDFMRVARVQVENTQRTSEAEIAALSDIKVGDRILELDLEMIAARIEENPWVRQARVDRIFPQDVRIRVAEREPRAIVNLGYLYYVDEGGEVFKMLDGQDRLDYPVITGMERDELVDNPQQAQDRLRRAISLLGELEQRRHFNIEAVSEIHLDARRGIALYTYRSAVPVHLGEGDYAAKLDRFERIYKELEPRLAVLEYIDLQVSDRIIVRRDAGTASTGG
ncbi:MAG TPA: FtsQ-type POTRA domain-containing protein [Geoalkalibacter subterraneus]|uniref:Cell division protein FtsQ n=1 Tax=Geoalkalibacter subterraneus TaxID=483547 RepID=A0A831PJL5_9BACT|nr:FtsQ-type POTRA domain-containing protein [Geoalkalibacter subterraneus]